MAAQVEEAAAPMAAALGLELVDVVYVKEGGNWYLRLFIDREGGVTLDDCQAMSEKLDRWLDEVDPVPQSYHLEVSSPGLERPLKKPDDFRRFQGRMIQLSTFAPVEGRKKFTGLLVGAGEESVQLEIQGRQLVIPMEQVAAARLKAEF
ncbi:ribosome maturation factor RimP [Desulfotomaculum copahuensis]|uniref:ribosome maturation factor RimP n=1 Tax=Desulfotomaculum copahuensis TaxID=1838280 RepID=UPI003D0793AF